MHFITNLPLKTEEYWINLVVHYNDTIVWIKNFISNSITKLLVNLIQSQNILLLQGAAK